MNCDLRAQTLGIHSQYFFTITQQDKSDIRIFVTKSPTMLFNLIEGRGKLRTLKLSY